ncbi:hypothetical protein [Gorillibacterium sp. sgz500922]|uniref:hypothetical protein n=1 Tax=Gorillibacterium sp. sgz500922 TaxID=3446694 RepID=UPI003F67CE52
MNETNPDRTDSPQDRKEPGKLEDYQRLQQKMESGRATREDAEFSAELAAGSPAIGSPLGMRRDLGRSDSLSAPAPETYGSDRIEAGTAADAAPQTRIRTGDILGWSAFVLALLSLFVFPAILGVAAIVLGVVSVYQGNRALGAWAVLIGVVTTITNLIVLPFLS